MGLENRDADADLQQDQSRKQRPITLDYLECLKLTPDPKKLRRVREAIEDPQHWLNEEVGALLDSPDMFGEPR